MSDIVRVQNAWDIVNTNLSDLIALPDVQAAPRLNERMALLDQIHKIHERSYSERGIIAREFERRKLWQHLVDPDTGQVFPNFTAWMSCSDFLGCRRVNFEAKKDMEGLEDVPQAKLLDVPKGNIKVLKQLSTKVRNKPEILEAARNLPQNKLLQKIEQEEPDQIIEAKQVLRFSPGRSWVKTIEKAIEWAIENDIAGTRDEALLRMAETALEQWELDFELSHMEPTK
jgi:hypothetical protein